MTESERIREVRIERGMRSGGLLAALTFERDFKGASWFCRHSVCESVVFDFDSSLEAVSVSSEKVDYPKKLSEP